MCTWKSKYFTDYVCNEPALEGDRDDYCILHSAREDKDPDAFKEKVQERIASKDKIDLIGCYFPKGFACQYSGCKFDIPVDFREATFSEGADFSWTTFSKGADFSWATFSEVAYFSVATFSEVAYFNWATFSKGDFVGTTFSKGANFSNAEFRERVRFRSLGSGDTKVPILLGPGSSFYYTRLPGEVIFQDVDLSHCSFLHSNIDKVDFRYCEFEKTEGLFFFSNQRKNVLRDELEADNACHSERSEESRPFAFAQGDGNKKLREEEYEPVRRLYLELKRNFEDKKDWNTAGDFHYGEMECRRKGRLGGWLDFLLVTTYYWASGYGERPLRAFIVLCLLAFLVFPLFLSVNDFWPYISRKQPFCFWNCAGEFFDSLKNSLRVATFTTVTKIGKEIYPNNSWDWVILVLESIFVYIQIFLLALALRRKVKR